MFPILHWMSFWASVVVGINFIGLAVFLTAGVRTKRLGIVLGIWAMWSLIFFLSVAAVDTFMGAYAVLFPVDSLSLITKLITAIASSVCLWLVAKGVLRLRKLPLSGKADKALSEFSEAMSELRNFHEHGRTTGQGRAAS